MNLFAFLFCLLAAGASASFPDSDQVQLPNYIKICRRNDPELNECIKSSVEVIKPYMKEGIPELEIPPCEPLVLPNIVLNQGKGSVVVQSTYNDLEVFGATNFHLHQVKVDLAKNKVKVNLQIPKLEIKGHYTISGKILMLPIAGKGLFSGNYSNIEAIAIIHGENTERNGKTYVDIKKFFIDFTVGHASVHLSNLFDGDKQLGASMNEFLNDNWKNVADEMKPVLESTVSSLFKSYAKKIFDKYPLETLLPS